VSVDGQRCETSANVILRTANHATRAPMTFLATVDQGPWRQNGSKLPRDGIAVYHAGAVNKVGLLNDHRRVLRTDTTSRSGDL